jgi:enoyl-CoA hydratase
LHIFYAGCQIVNAFKTVIYEKQDHIGYVALNRPDRLNAYSIQMRDDLYEVMNAIKADNDVRVVVIRGVGEKAFCAGADLSEFLTAPSPTAARRIRFERDIWQLFLTVQQPLIAALHGFILGSGIEIALCCDIRIASENARFALPEMGLGIIPAAGGTQTLPRTVGCAKAMEMILTADLLDSSEALRIGLVNRVVPDDALVAHVTDAAEKIAACDPFVAQRAKQALMRGMDLPLDTGLALERRLAI